MITYEMKSAQKWLMNECNVKPAYLQRMVVERKDKPKMTRKEKKYDLMMLIYISTHRACGRI